MLHKLHRDSRGVSMHEYGLKSHEALGSYDALDVTNVAGIESLIREVQLVEYAYARDSLGGGEDGGHPAPERKGRGASRGRGGGAAGAYGFLDEYTAFRGQRDTGDAMTCPSLVEWVGKQVERDASILKAVRKAREERAEADKGGQ